MSIGFPRQFPSFGNSSFQKNKMYDNFFLLLQDPNDKSGPTVPTQQPIPPNPNGPPLPPPQYPPQHMMGPPPMNAPHYGQPNQYPPPPNYGGKPPSTE